MLAKPELIWNNGVGFLEPINPIEYGKEYFEEYERRAITDIGRAILDARLELVDRFYRGGSFCDIGIGSGEFVSMRNIRGSLTKGYDVNIHGIRWLRERNLWANPYAQNFTAMSFWDVIEHIPNYPNLLRSIQKWLFASLPIFRDKDHALGSKHFKPGEHCWYFTRQGFIDAMGQCGFRLVDRSTMESELGREDIETFVFQRP